MGLAESVDTGMTRPSTYHGAPCTVRIIKYQVTDKGREAMKWMPPTAPAPAE